MHDLIIRKERPAPAGNRICGIEFYKAVLADHVRTWEEFVQWQQKNPPESLYYWRPDGSQKN